MYFKLVFIYHILENSHRTKKISFIIAERSKVSFFKTILVLSNKNRLMVKKINKNLEFSRKFISTWLDQGTVENSYRIPWIFFATCCSTCGTIGVRWTDGDRRASRDDSSFSLKSHVLCLNWEKSSLIFSDTQTWLSIFFKFVRI